MKIAYVVPRYGPEIRGGAETGARMLAEHLVELRADEVEVFTTCATDALTWKDELDPGTTTVNGVVVHRLRSKAGRDPSFHPYSGALLGSPESATAAEADRWVDLQGPLCPDLVEAVRASDADLVAFYPYLYYPTVRGVPAVAERAILHPAAHDEPPLHLGVFDPVFRSVQGLVFQTRSEQRLVEARFGVATTPQVVVGLGVEEGPGAPAEARAALGLGDAPYLVCVGRVDDKKGTGMLARYVAAYKARHPGPLKLVLAGEVVDQPEPHPDVVVTGPVDDAMKWGLLRGATALVSPSPWEAFSIVVIEAMTVGVPVVVNALCGPTREHCERSGGGLWFAGFGQFEAVVDRLLSDPVLAHDLGAKGRRYAEANYAWGVLTARYGAFLEGVVRRRDR
jgi:glycosyltransferase involved in cell wall biosynthesis